MAAAASLRQAALQAWTNLDNFSVLGTLKTKMLAYVAAIQGSFVQQTPNDHPIRNWIAVIAAYTNKMTGNALDWPELRGAADLIYRINFMGHQANTQVLITPAQAALLLAQYNAIF